MTSLPTLALEHLREQRTLRTSRLVLEPLGPQHLQGLWQSLHDPDSRRLTGTHASFTEQQIVEWLASRQDAHDRADWAITCGGLFIGEIVLNDLDTHNRSMGLRISLGGAEVFDRGYGTEALRAVVTHGFDDVGLHRISLEVYSFNPRARRVYEKCGFVEEGRQRDALLWDGRWYDAVLMGVLATDTR